MTALSDFALGLSGLIAYYPLIENGEDVSGLFNDLTVMGVDEPEFNHEPVTIDCYPSYSIKTGQPFTAGFLGVVQPTNTRSVVMFVRMPDDFSVGYSGLFNLNSSYSSSSSYIDYRFFFQIYPDGELHVNDGMKHEQTPKATGVYLHEYEGLSLLVVAQESLDGEGVELFFDDTLIYSRPDRNGFKELTKLPERLFVLGTFLYGTQQSDQGVDVSSCVLLDRRITEEERDQLLEFKIGNNENKVLQTGNLIFSNRETVEVANYYPDIVVSKVFNKIPLLAAKSGFYSNILDSKGIQRPMGYFESKVLIQDVPAPNRKVMCFTQHGQLLDETYSSEDGTYRFDHLLLDTKYLFVAHDNQTTPNTPPEYQAVAAGFQTATPY